MNKQKMIVKTVRSVVIGLCAASVSTPAISQQNGEKATMDAIMAQQGASARPTISNQRVNTSREQTPRDQFGGPQQLVGAAQVAPSQDQPLSRFQGQGVQMDQLLPLPGTFEKYVESVTGKELKIFGQNLFTNVPTTFAPIDTAQVNPDYVVGPGDELQILGWGMVDIDLDAVVDRSGAVNIPRVGNIKVAGVKYRDLQGHLTKAVSHVFTNFQLTVSISQTHAVQVYVVGYAVRPGTYTLSSMSTLLNALFTSGGPNAAGSMRRIQLKRGADIVTTFDLYDMLIHGDKTKDVSLRDGDVIYIAEAGPMIALTGNVKQPGIFEMKGKTSIADVVSWAGGYDATADGKSVVVEKSVNNVYQTVANVPGDSRSMKSLAAVPAAPSDVVRVFSPGAVPVQIQLQHEYVKVSGEAKQSGVFEIRPGETLRQLIERVGGTNENGYLFATSLKRESTRKSQQIRLNEAADRFERDVEASASGRLAHASDKDTVAAINADLEREHRIADRLRQIKAEGRVVLELANANAQVKDLPDLPLQDGDTITIPRKPGTVDVIGSVFQQNSIIFYPNRTVDDYLAMAGGATAGADKSEIYLIRADGSAKSGRTAGWFGGIGSITVNPGDAIIVPEKVERNTWAQSFKEWTTILYQFGLGAAGLKVLKN